MKLVCADLPRPNSAEEDGYGGGGVKISAAGASTAALGFEKLELERGRAE